MLDVVIIGAGPIGLACGIECEKRNMKYKILEKDCLVHSIFNYPKNMTFFSTSQKLEIGDVPFISHGAKPTRTEALEYYRRVKEHWGLDVHLYESVSSVAGAKGNFTIKTDKAIYNARYVIVATGFYDYPNMMNIPGEELPKVKHYYDEPHPYVDQKIVVVGGANSAVDVALETYRRGADVTMVIRDETIDDGVKYWVKPDIENRIKEGSIKAYFNSELTEITEKEATIKTPDGKKTIENDFVLAMTGYHPDYTFLKTSGITFTEDTTKEPIHDEKTYQTEAEGLFLAGVVCCGMNTRKWFIENSRAHAYQIFAFIDEMEQ